MHADQQPPSREIYTVCFYSLFFLVVFQLLTDFVEAVYGFGLFGTGIPPEIAAVLVLFSPLILLVLPRGLPRWLVILLGEIVILSRCLEVALDTRGQMLVTAAGLACLTVFFPALLKFQADAPRRANDLFMICGLSLALALVILLRALGSGLDITVDGSLRWLGWALALAAALLLPQAIPSGESQGSAERTSRTGKIIGLYIGIISALIFLFYTFTNPGLLARWAETSYLAAFGGVFLVLLVFSLLLTNRRALAALLNPILLFAWNALFILVLTLSLLPRQVQFPSDPLQYPLNPPAESILADLAVAAVIMLFPVILLDFQLLTREMLAARPSWRQSGIGFALAGLFLLVMILAHAFTTVYDYIPVVGPYFRDRYWLVYLIAILGLALPLLLVRRASYRPVPEFTGKRLAALIPLAIALIGLGAAWSVWAVSSQEISEPSQAGSLRVFTYNVQQGYSGTDQRNYDGQIELIRSQQPDILGLQESDSLRIANGNADLVRYFADRLDMYAYYGPTPINGTFGNALLSKYPIENPRTFYMYSAGEQTATVVAQITAAGKTYNVYVTHLGNGGPIEQQEAILRDVAGKNNVILMGDFNFRTYEPQYPLTTQSLVDAWLAKWPSGSEDNGLRLDKRIDYIFSSPGIEVLDARYLTDPQSDHPALYAELR